MDSYDKYHKYKNKYLGGSNLKVEKGIRYDINGLALPISTLIGSKIQLHTGEEEESSSASWPRVSTWRVLNSIPMLTGPTLILVVPPVYWYDDHRTKIEGLPPNENHDDVPDKTLYRYKRRDDPNYREGAKVVHIYNGKTGLQFKKVFEYGVSTTDRLD